MPLRVSLASLVATLALAACPGGDSTSLASLTRVEPGAPTEVCPDGGTTVSHGLDDNDNGILDDAEVDGRAYECDEPPAPPPGGAELTVSSDEPPGVHCAEGGQRVDSGLDRDGDGQLDPEEVDHSEYVCRGAEVHATLSQAVAEPAGAHCEHGGVAVHQGVDLDDDGVLDEAEIESTSYVCDPAPPAPAELSDVAIEPAGAHCLAGGTVEHTGHDVDADGVLDASEVEHSEYHCDGVLVGDYDIDSPQAAEALAGIQVITGNLNIDPADVLEHYDIVLPDLKIVGGDVVSAEPVYLDSFSAPELVEIGGDLAVYSELRIDGLHLPRLAEVDGYVYVMSLQLESIALPALERVGGQLSLTAGGDTVDLTSLRTVGGELAVHSHTEHLVMPQLTEVGGLDLSGTPDLIELRAPRLQRVDRRLRIGSSSSLTAMDFSALSVVGQDLHVVDAPVDTLRFPALEVVGGELMVFHASTKTIEVPQLRTVGRLDLSWLGLTALDLPALEQANEISILRHDDLVSISAPKLRAVDTLWLSHMPRLASLQGLGALDSVASLTISHCDALVDFSGLAKLDTVGIFSFGSNNGLVRLGLPALRTVTDYLEIGLPPEGNLALERVDLPALTFARGMIIQGNHALTELHMPELTQIVTALRVHYNARLPQCVVDAFHAGLAEKPAEYAPYHNDGVCPR